MSDDTYIDWYMEKRKLQQEIEKQRKEICDKTDEIQKLQNEITDMCHDVFELQAGVKELKNENKQLRELVCEYGLNIADQDYLLRPDTISRTIDIMVEEKGKDGWYGNKLKEKQGGYSND